MSTQHTPGVGAGNAAELRGSGHWSAEGSVLNCVEFGDCRETMRRWATQGVKAQMCVTSPPYFGLRSYMPDAVKLRSDISPEELASVIHELERIGVKPCAHTSE